MLGRSTLRSLLGGSLLFGFANAAAGGFYGLSGARGVPVDWLSGSPFNDYFVPSLILLLVVGGAFLFAATAVFAELRIALLSAVAAALILFVWIGVQVSIIGYVSWMQPVTALFGGALLVQIWFWSSAAHTTPARGS